MVDHSKEDDGVSKMHILREFSQIKVMSQMKKDTKFHLILPLFFLLAYIFFPQTVLK